MKPLLAITISILFAPDLLQAGPFHLDGFRQLIVPFVKQHCVARHNAKEAEVEIQRNTRNDRRSDGPAVDAKAVDDAPRDAEFKSRLPKNFALCSVF